jgi:hypothetical protein
VAAIAQRHGGAVHVQGSAFTLDLPAIEREHSGGKPRPTQ